MSTTDTRAKLETHRRRKQAPDWFGCGRIITQESWDGFLAARRAFYEAESKRSLTQERSVP
jgi:hypothetical protein